MMDTPLPVCADGATDIGVRRANNEDAWWAGALGGEHEAMAPGPDPLALDGRQPVLLVVSDGVGGSNAGEVASRTAIETVASELLRSAAALHEPQAARAAVLAALHAADAAVKAKGADPAFEGMGATLSLLLLPGQGTALWGQAGDSRIYLCRAGRLRQVSRDHSPVGRMRQRGELTEAEARRHPARNQIDQSLGNTEAPFQPEAGTEEVRDGDVFLVCSDGLNDGLWDHEIERALSRVREPAQVRAAVEGMVAASKEASGRDNITAVVALAGSGAGGEAGPAAPFWRRILGAKGALASRRDDPQSGGAATPAP
jgi:protein phosphatase